MNAPLKYRSDIDGLRAVAVLGVIFFHAFPKALPGGFIGVDIFFVISGYLISGILYKGHREGDFSFREFYARRIRRLFPALITLLVLCLGYGSVVLLPTEYDKLGRHVAAGTLFMQNFVFWRESGYFDTSANLKPLLHLWSLAVEEQFYIGFPILLILLWKKSKILLPAMVVLLVASFIANIVMSLQCPETAFYLTPYRGWEFLSGGLLAWWHYDRGHEEEIPKYREVLSWTGVLIMGLGMALFEKPHSYPGWRAMIPVVGTLLLIEGGKGAWVNKKILSNPVTVWIGLISYPLYLFHWPALSFVRIVKGDSASEEMVWTALGVAFLLTLITYYAIEKKIRHNTWKYTIHVLVAVFVLLGITGLLIGYRIINLDKSPLVREVCDAIIDNTEDDGWKIISKKNDINIYECGKGSDEILLIGDSALFQYAPRVEKIIREQNINIHTVLIWSPANIPIRNCNKKNSVSALVMEKFYKELKNKNVKKVIIAAMWDMYFNQPGWSYKGEEIKGNPTVKKKVFSEFESMIKELTNDGKEVFVVSLLPYGPLLDPKGFYKRDFQGTYYKGELKFPEKDFWNSDNLCIENSLIEAVKKGGGTVIRPSESLIKDGFCVIQDHGKILRFDGHHLRHKYVRDYIKYLDPVIGH